MLTVVRDVSCVYACAMWDRVFAVGFNLRLPAFSGGDHEKDVFVTGNCLFVLFCSQATLLVDIYADIDIYSQQPLMQTSKQTIKHA